MRTIEKSRHYGSDSMGTTKKMNCFTSKRTTLKLCPGLLPDIPIQILVSRHITLVYIVTFQIRNHLGHIKTLNYFKLFKEENVTLHVYIHICIHSTYI